MAILENKIKVRIQELRYSLRYFPLIILIFTGNVAYSQGVSSPSYKDFIPKGYQLLDSASGDLNSDRYPDLVLILKTINEDSIPDSNRPLYLLTGTPSGELILFGSNDRVVLCKGCGGAFGDPYQGITVKSGYFSIEHYGGSSWRWTRIITFKYDNKSGQFILHRDAGVSFHATEPDAVTDIIHNKERFGKQSFSDYSR